MTRSTPKTDAIPVTPDQFIASMPDGSRKRDAVFLLAWMTKVTGLKPKMWGPGIIGFGRYAYTYDSGHSGEFMMTGFSPRKANLVVYILTGFADRSAMLARLGRHRIGKSCLYLASTADIDMDVLAEMVSGSLADIRAAYQSWDC